MPDNRAMLRVFEDAGSCPRGRSTAATRGAVPDRSRPRPTGRRVDERDHVAVAASLAPFFAPAHGRRGRRLARRGSIGGRSSATSSPADFAGAAYPVNREGEPGRRRAGLPVDRRDPEPIDLGVDLRSRRSRARRGRGGAAEGDARALRDLGGVRGDRDRGHPPPGAAARARARARRAPRRPELPRDLVRRGRPERDLRAPRVPGREHRLLLPERRARPRPARAGRRARPRPLGLRLHREQGGRLLERPARVLGGRPGHRSRPALPGVVRQPAQVRARRPAASRGRSRSWR